jgi:hypothetical protein
MISVLNGEYEGETVEIISVDCEIVEDIDESEFMLPKDAMIISYQEFINYMGGTDPVSGSSLSSLNAFLD